VLRIFIAFKNPQPSGGSEPANLGSNSMHANDQTAEEDYLCLITKAAKRQPVNICFSALCRNTSRLHSRSWTSEQYFVSLSAHCF
jgi:hypothetical protein